MSAHLNAVHGQPNDSHLYTYSLFAVPDVLPTEARHVSSPLDELTSRATATAAAVQLQRLPVKGVSAVSMSAYNVLTVNNDKLKAALYESTW